MTQTGLDPAALVSILEDVDGIIWEADAGSFCFSYVSAQAVSILGYPLADWYGDAGFWPSHIHPEDRSWAIEYCVAETRENRKHEFEYRMIAADGRIVWLKDKVVVIQRNGKPPLLRGVMIDITDRKRAELEEREARRMLQDIIDASADFIFVKDRDRRIMLANATYARAIGRTPAEVVGMSDIEQVPHPDVVVLWEPDDLRALAGETVHIPNDVALIGGETRYYDTIKAPLRDGNGSVIGLVAVARDITDRRKLEQALASARSAATTGRLAATVAHEINNPLAAILGQVEILRGDLSGHPQALETLTIISGQVDRIARTVKNLLGFARQRARGTGPVQPDEVLRTVVALFAATYASRGITLDMHLPPGLASVRADADGLQEILVNLLENGREVLSSGHRVRLEASTENHAFTLVYEDDGPGIAGDPEKLFDPFYTTKPDGTGLGLTIARRLAESFSGTLKAEPGGPPGAPVGARFVLRLPLAV